MKEVSNKLEVIALADIHPFHSDENVSRVGSLFKDDKDRDELIRQLFNGWKAQLGVVGLYPLSREQIEVAVKEREEKWQSLKDSKQDFKIKVGDETVYVGASDLLRTWQTIYTTDKGKVRVPKYGQVFAFRRVEVMPLVNAVRFKQGLDIISEVPATIRTYENTLERFIDTATENTQKTAGARKLGDVENVNLARRMFREQAKESDFNKVWKRGTAQKLYALCKLDARYEEAGIIDNIVAGNISFGPLDKEKMRQLSKDANATMETVMEYFSAPSDSKNQKKIASRNDILILSEQSPVHIIREVARAIYNDDTKSLNRYVDVAPAMNDAFAAIMAGEELTIKAKAKSHK